MIKRERERKKERKKEEDDDENEEKGECGINIGDIYYCTGKVDCGRANLSFEWPSLPMKLSER